MITRAEIETLKASALATVELADKVLAKLEKPEKKKKSALSEKEEARLLRNYKKYTTQ
jgi:hypothetical protein